VAVPPTISSTANAQAKTAMITAAWWRISDPALAPAAAQSASAVRHCR
jgi:hypothetical protein